MSGDAPDAPIEGQVLLVAAAKASITASDLPDLVREVQEYLWARVEEYDARFERVHEDPPDRYFLVPTGHWDDVGETLGLDEAERDAVRRAHRQQLLRHGRRAGRREEFESALDIREAVVIRGGK